LVVCARKRQAREGEQDGQATHRRNVSAAAPRCGSLARFRLQFTGGGTQ
jgi:hypothetical protein